MPGCHVALASEEEQIQETQDGWAITLHVHHTAHQEGANSLCAATECGLDHIELMLFFHRAGQHVRSAKLCSQCRLAHQC